MVRMGMPPDPDDETPMRSHADAEPEPGAAPGPGAESLLAVAIEAAHAAAADLVGRFGQSMTDVRAKSSPTDLVSEADVAAETAIRAVLARRRPDDAILGEEGGATGDGDGDLRWVIDPLDGTTNFLFGVPQWAVSVACEDRDGALVGVVLDPNRSELFYAADMRARQAQVLTRVLPAVRDIRRAGAAALDLAWLACGRYDLYWERGVKPWDIAAGGLIARRAGLETVTLAESDDGPSGIIAGPPRLVAELRALVLGD
jgi:myo-inositol-1(or 4)-monophosphatase